jgi:anti-sigma regulatory factor (Ser/Thr protein kinase)
VERALASEMSMPFAPGAHLVQFYDSDDDLTSRVGSYLGSALSEGGTAIVIATPAHIASFERQLARAGIDVGRARDDGALLTFDAAAALAGFLVDGEIDAATFDTTIGEVVRAAAARDGRVHAFGEMVALLWQAGDITRAMQLEQLWNDLRAGLPFTLYCAYPNWLTQTPDGVKGFTDVCAEHSAVVAAAPASDTAEVIRHFPRSPAAPAAARHFVADWLAAQGHDALVERALLAVSELATNAVLHACSDFTVSLHRVTDAVRITVGDASAVAPERIDADITSPNGRGLALVNAVAATSGHRLFGGGKLVWADLPVLGVRGVHVR